jgi:hypothetical protein
MTEQIQQTIQRAIMMRRLQLNQWVFQQLEGVVRYGPLAGYRLLEESSWGNDKGAKLLGFYEQELLEVMVPALGPRKTLLDIGAADGYFALGFLHAGLAEKTIAFELTERGRNVIAATAQRLNLADRIAVHGCCTAADLIAAVAPLDKRSLVVLCDTEGAEFDILSDEALAALSGASVFVEVHDHGPGGAQHYAELKARAQRLFRVRELRKAGRNPYHYAELQPLDDTDHWLLCSEGRDPDAKWLALTPIHG